jgi:predicted DNA-binding protein
MTRIINLDVDDKTFNRLEEIAKATDYSESQLIHEAIEQYISEYTDYQIAMDRLHDVHDEIISSKKMRELLAPKN